MRRIRRAVLVAAAALAVLVAAAGYLLAAANSAHGSPSTPTPTSATAGRWAA